MKRRVPTTHWEEGRGQNEGERKSGRCGQCISRCHACIVCADSDKNRHPLFQPSNNTLPFFLQHNYNHLSPRCIHTSHHSTLHSLGITSAAQDQTLLTHVDLAMRVPGAMGKKRTRCLLFSFPYLLTMPLTKSIPLFILTTIAHFWW
jgi:hypothetical protein